MGLEKKDTEFRLPQISYIDFKHLEMDRVLTALFARLNHNGYPSRLNKKSDKTVDDYVDGLMEDPEKVDCPPELRAIFKAWVETHLLDIVNRGKINAVVASPRPLHGFVYQVRNPKHSRDYNASQQIYEMLHHARGGSGQRAIDQLKTFFFEGFDPITKRWDASIPIDVETQALIFLIGKAQDTADTQGERHSRPPACQGLADLMADDIQRLLSYRACIPRTVMVEYLKILISFHLAIYFLRLFKLLPSLVKYKGKNGPCTQALCPINIQEPERPFPDCPYQIGLFVDATGGLNPRTSQLAQRSADGHYRRIPDFVKANFSLKKLDEFSKHLIDIGKWPRPANGFLSLPELASLLVKAPKTDFDQFFGQRLYRLWENVQENPDAVLDPELEAIKTMNLPSFEAYINCIMAIRGGYHRKYLVDCLDSLFLKNRSGAVIAQGKTRSAQRRFVLDSKLLEVLIQLAVLKPGGTEGVHTEEIRVDGLLFHLRNRYGLFIDQLPENECFDQENIEDRKALRENRSAFLARLRETGFYRDLSDAYLAQTVSPRYRIGTQLPKELFS